MEHCYWLHVFLQRVVQVLLRLLISSSCIARKWRLGRRSREVLIINPSESWIVSNHKKLEKSYFLTRSILSFSDGSLSISVDIPPPASLCCGMTGPSSFLVWITMVKYFILARRWLTMCFSFDFGWSDSSIGRFFPFRSFASSIPGGRGDPEYTFGLMSWPVNLGRFPPMLASPARPFAD